VTPSSKVVGELAQVMVSLGLTKEQTLARAGELDLPTSVAGMLQGQLGHPIGGWPKEFQSKVLKKAKLQPLAKRPGLEMADFDFEGLRKDLASRHGEALSAPSEKDILSSSQFKKEFDQYVAHRAKFGRTTLLATEAFFAPLQVGDETSFDESGKRWTVKLVKVSDLDADGNYPVVFAVNGQPFTAFVKPAKGVSKPFILQQKAGGKAAASGPQREKANPGANKGHVGAPMPGKIIAVKCKVGDVVEKGAKLVTVNSMKMETEITAPVGGVVKPILASADDAVAGGDLLLEIQV